MNKVRIMENKKAASKRAKAIKASIDFCLAVDDFATIEAVFTAISKRVLPIVDVLISQSVACEVEILSNDCEEESIEEVDSGDAEDVNHD